MPMSTEQVFCHYFATIVGWSFHPGKGDKPIPAMTLDAAAAYALDMTDKHNDIMRLLAQKEL